MQREQYPEKIDRLILFNQYRWDGKKPHAFVPLRLVHRTPLSVLVPQRLKKPAPYSQHLTNGLKEQVNDLRLVLIHQIKRELEHTKPYGMLFEVTPQ